ncbi:lycopene cyclase domain-containing protein [Phytomonospora sp. NPDC050363]|uniref:lycopene cyclase domain-containing protein n=1 Tax=Phytomonospora sp. NPDC050363 TaxID=3155642 RepID=UPI0033C3CBF0
MTAAYTVTAAAMVLVAVVVDLFVLRTRLLGSLTWWLTYPIVLVFQLLSNGVLSSAGVVHYRPDTILGLRVFHAPVEDLGFGFALVLATLSVWVWRERRESKA